MIGIGRVTRYDLAQHGYGLLRAAKIAQQVRCFDQRRGVGRVRLCRQLEKVERFLTATQRPQCVPEAHAGARVTGFKFQHASKAALSLFKVAQVTKCMTEPN